MEFPCLARNPQRHRNFAMEFSGVANPPQFCGDFAMESCKQQIPSQSPRKIAGELRIRVWPSQRPRKSIALRAHPYKYTPSHSLFSHTKNQQKQKKKKEKAEKKMSYGIYELRQWMYSSRDPQTGEVTKEFQDGLRGFIYQATSQTPARERGKVKIFCPCLRCENRKYWESDIVAKHLFNRGFMPNYYVWYYHGEGSNNTYAAGGSDGVEQHNNYNTNYHNYGHMLGGHDEGYQQGNRFNDMVRDAFHETSTVDHANNPMNDMLEEPNIEAQKFYDMLDAANQPLYDGCEEGLSKLSLASRMLTIKSEDNTSEQNLDKWAALFHECLPKDNLSPRNYYEINKLVAGLGLPSQMIDVCIDNCMIF